MGASGLACGFYLTLAVGFHTVCKEPEAPPTRAAFGFQAIQREKFHG